jgi:exocyst complex component 4
MRPPRSDINGKSRAANGRIDTTVMSPLSPSSETDVVSPRGVEAVLAFQSIIARRRGKAGDDYADVEYEREKQREMAIQMDRQKRIKEKVPGRKATKPRAGDIDGESHTLHIQHHLNLRIAVLDEIKDEWEIVTNPDVSCYVSVSLKIY